MQLLIIKPDNKFKNKRIEQCWRTEMLEINPAPYSINNVVIKEKHSMNRGINPSSKTLPLSFLPIPPLNLKTAQAPLLGNPPSISVFREPPALPPPKSQIFNEHPKY